MNYVMAVDCATERGPGGIAVLVHETPNIIALLEVPACTIERQCNTISSIARLYNCQPIIETSGIGDVVREQVRGLGFKIDSKLTRDNLSNGLLYAEEHGYLKMWHPITSHAVITALAIAWRQVYLDTLVASNRLDPLGAPTDFNED